MPSIHLEYKTHIDLLETSASLGYLVSLLGGELVPLYLKTRPSARDLAILLGALRKVDELHTRIGEQAGSLPPTGRMGEEEIMAAAETMFEAALARDKEEQGVEETQ